MRLHRIRCGSWNIAGASQKALEAISSVWKVDLVAIQEFPKGKPGWSRIDSHDMEGWVHQDVITYRGIGLCHRKGQFRILKKKATMRGTWFRVEHLKSAKKLWVGSIHLPKNEPVAEFRREISEFQQALPAGDSPALVLGDYNIDFVWQTHDDRVTGAKHDTRWEEVKNEFGTRGMEQIPPTAAKKDMPTFIPRRTGIRATQIDGAWAKGLQCSALDIREGSKTMAGSDHNQVEVAFVLAGEVTKKTQRRGGPRQLVAEVPTMHVVTQKALQEVSARVTAPKPKRPQFRCSAAANTLRAVAKRSQAPNDWKAYQKQMRRGREEWNNGKLERALHDWDEYKELAKKKRPWADSYLTQTAAADPTEDMRSHFQQVLQEKEHLDVDAKLEEIKNTVPLGERRPVTMDEVRRAVALGKGGKAVGEDGISNEVLKAMMRNDISVEAMAKFFTEILIARQVPSDWSAAIIALLPKLQGPSKPSDLRPIALASHLGKCFSRIVVRRLSPYLTAQGGQQAVTKGRQACDVCWATRQLCHNLREWKSKGILVKLDIRKAFDSVRRDRLGEQIAAWCNGGDCDATACLIDMLKANDLLFSLPWTNSHVTSDRGVKQGAGESPTLFSRLLDSILMDMGEAKEPILAGFKEQGLCFMDDALLWQGSIKGMQALLDRLAPRLRHFGLVVQPLKCQCLIVGDIAPEPMHVGDVEIRPQTSAQHISVLNLPMGLQATDLDILAALMAKARAKYQSVRPLLLTQTALGKRLALLDKTVLGSLRWALASIFPSSQCQQVLNHFQLACIRPMLRLVRRRDEWWHEFEVRSCRIARQRAQTMGGRPPATVLAVYGTQSPRNGH